MRAAVGIAGAAESANDGNTSSKRRGAYMIRGYSSSRDVTPNFLQAFDVDDGRAPCPMRTQTVTAPQALFLMNSPDIDKACAELAVALAKGSARRRGPPVGAGQQRSGYTGGFTIGGRSRLPDDALASAFDRGKAQRAHLP